MTTYTLKDKKRYCNVIRYLEKESLSRLTSQNLAQYLFKDGSIVLARKGMVIEIEKANGQLKSDLENLIEEDKE